MCQSWLLHLCNVGLAASWLPTFLGQMAKLAIVVVDIVSCRLLVASDVAVGTSTGATLSTSSRPGLGASARLMRLAALVAARRGRGLPLLPVTLADIPLFPSVEVVLRHFHRHRSPRATRCGSFWSGLRSHKVLVMREYGGHEDLRGSGRRSVIPYAHG
jgi:hypothetical protein